MNKMIPVLATTLVTIALGNPTAQAQNGELFSAWGETAPKSSNQSSLVGNWNEQVADTPAPTLLAQANETNGSQRRLNLGNVSVNDLDADNARIVVSLPPGENRTNIRNENNQITVSIESMDMQAADAGRSIDVSNNSGLVDRYRLESTNGGVQVVFDLSEAVTQQAYGQDGSLVVELQSRAQPTTEVVESAPQPTSQAATPAAENGSFSPESIASFQPAPSINNNSSTAQRASAPAATNTPPTDSERISLSLQDVNIRQLLQIFANQRGINLVASDDVQGNVSVELNDVPWEQALDTVLKTKDLGRRREGNVIFVAPLARLRDEERSVLEARAAQESLLPLQSDVLQLDYASASEVSNILRETRSSGEEQSGNAIISNRGQVIADVRTNSLIVRELPANISRIKKIIDTIDRPVQQVMVDARIVLATDDFSRQIGAKWGIGGSSNPSSSNNQFVFAGSATGANNILNSNISTPGGANIALASSLADRLGVDLSAGATPSGVGPARVGYALLSSDFLLDLELSAIQAEGRGETLSNPRVLTTNNTEAVIKQGEEIPFSTVSQDGTQTQFREAVLELRVTPRITPSGKVLLDLKINKDERGIMTNAGPTINKREIKTQVLVDNQDTVVLGGVYEKITQRTVEKVPFLGDLPGVGRLFRRNSNTDTKFELLVFVTPTIIN